MDWIKDGIVEFLSAVYSTFFTGVDGLMSLAQTSPDKWHGGVVWKAVTDFNEGAVLPIAWTIMSLFLLFELANLFKRSDTKGLDGIYWIAQIFLKIGISKMLMENMDVIIGAIFEVSSKIITNGNKYLFMSGGSANISQGDLTALADALEGLNVLVLMGYFVIGIILWLAQSVCFVLCKVIIELRFVEIYAFTALSALAFATFPSQEYSQIGKNFVKRFVALAIHVVFICVVLYMYLVLIKSESFVVVAKNPLGALFSAFGYTILLVIALFQTGSWSKSLANAS